MDGGVKEDRKWTDGRGKLFTGRQVADLMRKPGGCGPFYRADYLKTVTLAQIQPLMDRQS